MEVVEPPPVPVAPPKLSKKKMQQQKRDHMQAIQRSRWDAIKAAQDPAIPGTSTADDEVDASSESDGPHSAKKMRIEDD